MRTKRFMFIHRMMFPSARCLRDELQRLTGERLLIMATPTSGDVMVRWGTSERTSGRDARVNTALVTDTCSSKLRFSKTLLDAHIRTPQFFTRPPEDREFPILVRKTLSGFGGAGIVPCRRIAEYLPHKGSYWTPYLTLDSEFRVHVLGGEIARVFRKISDHPEEREFNIRNLHNGWRFSLIDFNGRGEMKAVIKKLWDLLHFGDGMCAFDLAWSKQFREYVVIEGNSAPGLSENEHTLASYAEYVARFL